MLLVVCAHDRLFAGILSAESGSEAEVDEGRQQASSSPPTSIATEYYFLNVMFCREQVGPLMFVDTVSG